MHDDPACELRHSGLVVDYTHPDWETIPNQIAARYAVEKAMDLAFLGLRAAILWSARDYAPSASTRLFEKKIRRGVLTILESYSMEDERFFAVVTSLGEEKFEVLIVRWKNGQLYS